MTEPQPPERAVALLEWALPADLQDGLIGDLHEAFHHRSQSSSAGSARRWFWREALVVSLAYAFRRPRRRFADDRGDSLMRTFVSDVRHALRLFRNRPGFSVVAVAILAIGIGATTAIYSVIQPVLLQSLPYPHAERVVTLWGGTNPADQDNLGYATWLDIANGNKSFESIAVWRNWGPTVSGRSEPAQLTGQRVSQDYFKVLGIEPVLGRTFLPEEEVVKGPSVVVLSNGLWRSRFGGDPSIVGHSVTLNGISYTVVGVMPAGFENLLVPTAQLWGPLQYDLSLPYACRTCHHLRGIARLKPTVSAAAASADLNALSATMVREHPTEYARVGLQLVPLRDIITGGVRPVLLAVLGAVALVLLIACANVMNLMLAQGALRQGEFSLRAALGATRGRVIRQLLTESVTLAVLGGIGGLLLAVIGVRALIALSPAGLPRLDSISLDRYALLFALGLTALVGIVFGLVPALHASRSDLNKGLKQGSRRTGGRSHLVRSSLVVTEVALALLLLVGTGLLLQSVRRLLAVAPGFEPANLLTVQVQTTGPRYYSDSATWRYFGDVERTVRALPGVESAALTSQLPLSSDFDKYGVHIEAHPRANPEEDPSAHRYAVTAGYLATLGIPLRSGRDIDAHDVAGAPPVVLVNQSFARRAWPGEDPIGQRIKVGGMDGAWITIVGVVGDVHQVNLAEEQPDAFYLPEVQWQGGADGAMSLVVRSKTDPATLAAALRKAVWSVDPDQPIVRVATMDQLVASSAAQRRFALILFEAFASIALVLAAAGVYGVLAGVVTERLREIGVRSALGATPANIVAMIMGQGLSLTGLGAVAGISLALAAARLINGLLFGIAGTDPWTYLATTLLLGMVAVVACLLPAWRAAGVDPAQSLRSE